eukprot:TRINITY_DN47671_c0_g1_i1.p1 TRINITY_DN47671_c0_g1~~TRINITY_DN47671_c0_g1_i1.p1  ORF type:complete len:429 (+),score=46.57 TRINITY_DN47671_c0_g1_i1:84-1370(+)
MVVRSPVFVLAAVFSAFIVGLFIGIRQRPTDGFDYPVEQDSVVWHDVGTTDPLRTSVSNGDNVINRNEGENSGDAHSAAVYKDSAKELPSPWPPLSKDGNASYYAFTSKPKLWPDESTYACPEPIPAKIWGSPGDAATTEENKAAALSVHAPRQYIFPECRPANPKRHAFVSAFSSFIQREALAYVRMTALLGRMLREFSPDFPRILITEPNVTATDRCILQAAGWELREFVPVSSHRKELRVARLVKAYQKLHAWSLTEFDTVLVLDADTLPLDSIGELFCVPVPSGSAYAAQDTWPDMRPRPEHNSGVVLLAPSHRMHTELVAVANADQPVVNPRGGQQGMLNEFFSNRWLKLPDPYHFSQTLLLPQWQHMWAPICQQARILHYTQCKPYIHEPCAWAHSRWTLKLWHETYRRYLLPLETPCTGRA